MTQTYRTRDLSRLSVDDLRAHCRNGSYSDGTPSHVTRKIAHNTYASVRDFGPDAGAVVIRFHATDILTFHTDGSFTVSTGGYETVTTKQRLNALLPCGYRIFSKAYEWMIATPAGTVPFYSGDTFNAAREVAA